ncbi:host attachment protein [Aestuariivirga sp.]|uniref:baeRF12 domain-containing protein n=1 Tax=Aestuariivirga sp. TaxID=2650926 RepID=UPI00391C8EDC
MKRLRHNARVLVTDGGRAIVFRNAGQVGKPDLQQFKVYAHDNPPTREQGTDKPARVNESVGMARSASEQTDLHQQAEDRFVMQIADDMDKDLKAGEFEELIVVAPPVALGVYRKAASQQLQKATLMEINKDLTKHAASDVAAIVVKALEGD